jgi:citrate synthase
MEGVVTDELYMTAQDAAETLGVSVTTLYTYVSRGLIRSRSVPGAKSRKYWRADVAKIASGGKEEPPLPLQRNLVETTSITLITEQGHFYRGRSALTLAKTETLESMASLLWQAPEQDIFSGDLPTMPADGPGARLGDDLTPLQRAIAMLFNVEHANPRAYDLSPQGYRRSGADVLRCVAAACVGAAGPSQEPIHTFVIRALSAPDRYTDIVRHLFVLAADHELDPTTYAVRAAANTGVTPYAAAIAGLVSSSGRRLTFGQSSSVARLLDEIEVATDPRDPVVRRIREGESLPGFASKNYPAGDPRARSLLGVLHEHCSDDPLLRRVDLAASAMFEATGALPDFVLPVLMVGRQVGLRLDQGALVRMARVVGWIAHAMEQYHERDLVRPHASYAGELPVCRPPSA